MSDRVPFDPRTDAPLLSAYVDGELDAEDVARVEAHLAADAQARREVEELRRLKNLTGALRLKEAPPEEWEGFWQSVYNRTERSLGWVLLVIGFAIVAGWALWRAAGTFLETDTLPVWIKGAAVLGLGGLVVLAISVVRERIHKRSRTRYKDVIR